MRMPRPDGRPPLRQANDHLAEAYRRAIEAGDDDLAARISRVWQVAERRCVELEQRQQRAA